jgi:hypothetical protein
MISTTLMICIGVASAAIVIALMMWKPRNRFPASLHAESTNWRSRDLSFATQLWSFAAAMGLARAQAEQSGDGNPDSGHSWHGSHLDHTGHGGHSHDGGGSFSDGGGGGGDGGGGL